MRAVCYIRVSTEEQVQGHSLAAQRTSTNALIRQRGWTFVGEYVDAGVSAKSDSRRPALEQLLRDAQQGKFDVVVVDKVDRFYRHLKGLLATLEQLNALDITFVSVRENLDFATPWGKLTLTVLGMLAEIYIDNLSQETSKGKLARAREGQWNGSIPLGYCTGRCSKCTDLNGPGYCPHAGGADQNTTDHLIAHPIESVAVQRAFQWYLTGNYSDGRIAERLNQEPLKLSTGQEIHFRTKGLPGRWPPGPFGKESIREILQRRFYTGVVVYYGTDEKGHKRKRGNITAIFPGQHPALLSAEDFAKARTLRQQLSHRTRSQNGTPHVYLLSGLLICEQCGKPMRAMSSGGRYYYRDLTRIDHCGHCDQPTLKAADIEQQVLDLMSAVHLSPDWRQRVADQLLTPSQQTQLTTKRTNLKVRWNRTRELYLEGLLSKEEFQEERWRHQTGMTDLRSHNFSAIIEAGNVLETFPTALLAASTLKQNELLRLALVGVRVKGYLLTAVQVTLHFYPLMRHCLCGSDGI